MHTETVLNCSRFSTKSFRDEIGPSAPVQVSARPRAFSRRQVHVKVAKTQYVSHFLLAAMARGLLAWEAQIAMSRAKRLP